ncbi:MAG: hypothetical protein IPI11_05430 [Haliscomenobacter sp.]|nr:hypothetical protein [Haliscomenobacter sp.]
MNPFAIATLQLDELFEFLKDDAVGVAFYLEENDLGQYLIAKKAISSGGLAHYRRRTLSSGEDFDGLPHRRPGPPGDPF